MKKLISLLLFVCSISTVCTADSLNPYVLAGIDQGSMESVASRLTDQLTTNGFEVVGSYAPAENPELQVICIAHNALEGAVRKSGGLTGFAAVLRVGLNKTGNGVAVSYTEPMYWGNAYFRKDFASVESAYKEVNAALKAAMSQLPEQIQQSFGSKKGMTAKKLQKYHYMMSMPYFDDVNELDEGNSFEQSMEIIEKSAADNPEVDIVYAVKFPDLKIALYGTALKGEKGEKHFLPKIDFNEPRHVPFLPYELLVLDGKVVSLHGKYRIALSFPDLKMGTFMKIMSTPGDIRDAQKSLVSE
ncbi:MAG: hypothetical protein AB3N63_03805 [Puniceicoccaceae bacterium]